MARKRATSNAPYNHRTVTNRYATSDVGNLNFPMDNQRYET